jgi:hydrogenase maturation protein HypF
MVDNALDNRRLIGLAFDGAGYGTDGMIWGGEALLASFGEFERFMHLEYLPLPGRASIPHSPWRIAASYAHALGIDISDLPSLQNLDKQALRIIRQQIEKEPGLPLTSSMGRLFDTVASLIGVRNETTYQAQAALELEVLSKPFVSVAKSYPYSIEDAKYGKVVRLHELIQSIVENVRANEPIGRIAASFHKTIADISVDACKRARHVTGLYEVALSGGVWQNQILLDLVRDGLQQDGFLVYFHKQVPTNDGGLSLGQAVIANHLRTETSELAEERGRRGS